MKISEFIKRLESIKESYGDKQLLMCCADDDGGNVCGELNYLDCDGKGAQQYNGSDQDIIRLFLETEKGDYWK